MSPSPRHSLFQYLSSWGRAKKGKNNKRRLRRPAHVFSLARPLLSLVPNYRETGTGYFQSNTIEKNKPVIFRLLSVSIGKNFVLGFEYLPRMGCRAVFKTSGRVYPHTDFSQPVKSIILLYWFSSTVITNACFLKKTFKRLLTPRELKENINVWIYENGA